MKNECLVFNEIEKSNKLNKIILDDFDKILKTKTIKKELEKRKFKEVQISVILVENNVAKKLNKIWRNKNRIPDILSFVQLEKDKSRVILGDIFLTPNVLKKSKDKDIYLKLLIHGILHLLGYEHELDKDYEKMQGLEDKIFNEIN